MAIKDIKTLTIRNIGKNAVNIFVRPGTRLTPIFTRSGNIPLNPGQSIIVEEERIDISVLKNIIKLGSIKTFNTIAQVDLGDGGGGGEVPAPVQTVTVSFNPISGSKDNDKVGTYSINVEITTSDSQPLVSSVSVDVNDTGGTAIEGVDYTYSGPNTISFNAGALSGDALSTDVSVLGSNSNVDITFALSNPVGATIINGTFTLTLLGGGAGA